MRDNLEVLTIDAICEKLQMDDLVAKRIVDVSNIELEPLKEGEKITFIEFMTNLDIQQKTIKFFHENPYCDIKVAIKELGLKISPIVLKNSLSSLIDNGHKIPCLTSNDPMAMAKFAAEIIDYKQKNPYATPGHLSKKFGLSEDRVIFIIEQAAEQWKKEKLRSYEFYFKSVLEELDDLSSLCYERFHASPKSSSRWLEIAQNNTEKKIKLLGLNAPTELNIRQHVTTETKEEKDAIIEAFLATDMIDVSPKQKSLT